METYKISVLGGGAVGKTSVTVQYVHKKFDDEYDPTIEDSYHKQLVVDNASILLDILDTAGQEEYTSMRDQYMRSGNGFLLVYDITNLRSFEEIKMIHDRLVRIKDTDKIPLVLVGNKTDLESKRVVSQSEAKQLAKEYNCTLIEASAKQNLHVEDVFLQVIREMRKQAFPDGLPEYGESSSSGLPRVIRATMSNINFKLPHPRTPTLPSIHLPRFHMPRINLGISLSKFRKIHKSAPV